MWLVLDAGNSAVKGGLFEGETLRHTFRIDLEGANLDAPPTAALDAHVDFASIERVGLASVVPRLTVALKSFILARTGGPLTEVHHALRLPFALRYGTPHTLGNDRLAAAAAAWMRYGQDPPRHVVALDAGTAVTYEVVDADGVYRGGPIGAGPLLLRRALSAGTAQLPTVPLALPSEVVGRSTREALQSGIMYGFLDGVSGMLDRIAERLGAEPFVAATGGWSALLHDHLGRIDHVDPHLVLHGIRLLMELNPA